MSDTTFIDKQTLIQASWLNDVNSITYKAASGLSGSVTRTGLAKLADTVSVMDFGAATAASAATNTTAFLASEALSNTPYLPQGTFTVTGSATFSKLYWGPGSISYSGIGSTTFTGAGLNDLSLSGTFAGPVAVSVIVEILTTGTPDTYRISTDGGTTWLSEYVEVLPGDIEVITPLNVSTTPMMIGQTGVSVVWAATTGHTVGNRWTFTLRPNPKSINVDNAYYIENSLFAWMDGRRSVGVGQSVMTGGNRIGFENVGVGVDVLTSLTFGYGNTVVGVRAGQLNKTGFLNTYMGTWAGRDATTANGNTAIGAYSQVIGSTGGYNTSVGNDSLTFPNAGTENCAFGVQALHGNDEVQTGWNPQRNCAFGVQAMRDVENATFCSAFGFGVAPVAKSVSGLAAFGYAAFTALTTGNNNVGLGAQAGSSITTGNTNVFIGHNSGLSGSQKVDAVNTFALGANTFTTANNQGVIGNSSITDVFFYGHIKPQTDNLQDLGSGAARYRTVYAGTGTINTSDAREKEVLGELDERELAVARKLKVKKYKWKSAVSLKGEGARVHVGWIAQEVIEAFKSEGLDPFTYGVCCYDKWEENGEVKDRYSIRTDELLAFIVAALI